MDKRKVLLRKIYKYTIFALIVWRLYILQSIPGFLSFFGIKPVFIIPFCVALSFLDDSWPTGIICVLGGLLTDLSSLRIAGFFTIQLLIYCAACTIAVKFFFKSTRRNAFFISFAVMFLMLSVDFVFTYYMHGYKNGLLFYVKTAVLTSLYSSRFSPLFYKLIDNIIYSRFIRVEAR